MTRFLFLILAGIVAIPAFAGTDAQIGRFIIWLDILEKPLASSDRKNEAAEALMGENRARIAAFNLQALGRVYSGLDNEFDKIRRAGKELEDALGAIDKWKSLRNNRKLEEARESLADLLKDKNWMGRERSPRIRDIRKFLNNFKWPSEDDDMVHVANRLAKQLENVNAIEYDMSKLEEGNGLHELRRELRWFLIESRVVNGVVTFKRRRGCPVEAYSELAKQPIADSKYSKLPANDELEANPCRISRCLFLGVVDMVEEIGKIKDAAEKRIGNTDSDEVPADLRRKAEGLYRDFAGGGLLPALIKEVRACAG
jgi:hypothetical protein